MSDWGYTRDEGKRENKTGILRCVITQAETAVSKTSGKDMIVIWIRPSGCDFTVKNYIVKNEHFNKNMTDFYDAFPSIPEGNFDFLSWVGAEGAANFGEEEYNGYKNMKVKWFVSAEKAQNLPPFEGKKPEKQEVTTLGGDTFEPVENDGDLPF